MFRLAVLGVMAMAAMAYGANVPFMRVFDHDLLRACDRCDFITIPFRQTFDALVDWKDSDHVKDELNALKEQLESQPPTKSSTTGVTFSDEGLLGDIWNWILEIVTALHDGTLQVTQDIIDIAWEFLQIAIGIHTALAEFIVQWLFWLICELLGLCPYCTVPCSLTTLAPDVVTTTLSTPSPDTPTPTTPGGTSTVTYPE